MDRQHLMVLIVALATLVLHTILFIVHINEPAMPYIETALTLVFYEGIVVAVEVKRGKLSRD